METFFKYALKNRQKEIPHKPFVYAGFWRSGWDLNPRTLADNVISSAVKAFFAPRIII